MEEENSLMKDNANLKNIEISFWYHVLLTLFQPDNLENGLRKIFTVCIFILNDIQEYSDNIMCIRKYIYFYLYTFFLSKRRSIQ